MKPLAIRNWLFELHDGGDCTWETCSKTAGIMSLVFSFVDNNELYSIRNVMDKVTIPASEDEHEEVKVLLPEQTMNLLERLPHVVRIAVLLVACTGVRVSECLGLRWVHVKWNQSRIQIEQTFRRGEVQRRTKTKASKGPVPLCEPLSECLAEWRRKSPYSKEEDFVFASPTLHGTQPLWGQTMNADFIKPAAITLRLVAEGERFGWHRFRHSLCTWASEATKDITVSQTLLRHSDSKMTAEYIHANFDKALEAQRRFVQELLGSRSIEQLLGEPQDTELLAMKPGSEAIQ